MTADVLVLNAGSSSLKFQLLNPSSGEVAAYGLVERIGDATAAAHLHTAWTDLDRNEPVSDYSAALAVMRNLLADGGIEIDRLRVVGHRVVHGGLRFRAPTLIDSTVLQAIKELSVLAPLHNPANAAVIEESLSTLGHVPQIAVFDTAFFADLPDIATTYAIDRQIAERFQVRRFGFHGISHQYVSARAAETLGRDAVELNQIVLHLGNGASASAIRRGVAVDTSMGLTPLEGLVMGTRGGDIDPGALLHLQRAAGLSIEELDQLLNRRSGIKGLAGVSDMRDLHRLVNAGDAVAALALDVYCQRARKYVGAYLAVLGRADTLVFTAGVGENDADVRARITSGLTGLGIDVDPARNSAAGHESRIISTEESSVAVLAVPTNEELAIARQAVALLDSPSL